MATHDHVSEMDPPIVLVSYFPSRKAQPDENELFGFLSIRGICQSEKEAIEKAKELSKKDSQGLIIHHLSLQRAYPICSTAKRSTTIDYATMRKEESASRAAFEAIHQGKARATDVEVDERIRKLQTDGDSLNDLDRYITTRVKLAETSATLARILDRMPHVIEEARQQETPEIRNTYAETYAKATDELQLNITQNIRDCVMMPLDEFEERFCKWKRVATAAAAADLPAKPMAKVDPLPKIDE